ncbi:HMA2 domain-containing protein [Desulfohalovibrio reitneri]|uniref:HMA2 domain-containing protein n=1 Tax=Desulfohalovibrio reitneri TaxID=1307759 RepID=UPI0004A711C5|nr:hypothetical protein [Desulfohalovibrio reitneri]
MKFDAIASLRRYISIKHSLPGRIRIKFSKDILQDPDALDLVRSAMDLPSAVTDTKLNPFSRTLLIEYDPATVPPGLLEELITTSDDERASTIVEQLHEKLYN